MASSARFSWLRYQDFLVRRRLLLLLRRRRDAHIPTATAAVSVLRVAIVRVYVRDAGSPARAHLRRESASLVPSSSLRRSSCERASKQASILYLLARSLLGVAEAAGGEARGGEGAPTPTPTRASVVTWVGSHSQRQHCSQVPRRPRRRRRRRQCRCRQRRSVVRSVGERGRKEKSSSIRVPSARASVARQSEAVGPKSWGSRHHPPPSL